MLETPRRTSRWLESAPYDAVSCNENVLKVVVHLHLFVDTFISLASEDVKARGKGFFEDAPPVYIIPANRHAATLANSLELVHVVCPDHVGATAMGSGLDYAKGSDRYACSFFNDDFGLSVLLFQNFDVVVILIMFYDDCLTNGSTSRVWLLVGYSRSISTGLLHKERRTLHKTIAQQHETKRVNGGGGHPRKHISFVCMFRSISVRMTK